MNVKSLSRSLVAVAVVSLSQTAFGFINLGLPQPEAVPTSKVYACENGQGGGVVISIDEMKLYMTDSAANSQGLPMEMSDLLTARCPHTYSFKVNLMGQLLNGELVGGCVEGPITLSLKDPANQATAMEMSCVFKP